MPLSLGRSTCTCSRRRYLSHVWRVCLSDKNCVRNDSCGRVRPCVCRCLNTHTRARARARVRASWSVCVRVHAQRVCSARALPSHGGDLRYLKLGPRRALRPRARLRSVRPAVGLARVRPQVSRGRAARPARNGLADMGTRPWSTPPAPSTSSAAKAAPPTTTTCGRAPTEVRGPDTVSRGGRGYSREYYGGTQGYQGGSIGILRSTRGGYPTGTKGYSARGY